MSEFLATGEIGETYIPGQPTLGNQSFFLAARCPYRYRTRYFRSMVSHRSYSYTELHPRGSCRPYKRGHQEDWRKNSGPCQDMG
jgi:hypothetical protein